MAYYSLNVISLSLNINKGSFIASLDSAILTFYL